MSFDNNHYPNRKDWRRPYRRSKRFDKTCRCHGACSYCRDNRLHSAKRDEERVDEQLEEERINND